MYDIYVYTWFVYVKKLVCAYHSVWCVRGPKDTSGVGPPLLLIYDSSLCIARLAGLRASSSSPVPAVFCPSSTGITSSCFVLLSVDPGDMNAGPVTHMANTLSVGDKK